MMRWLFRLILTMLAARLLFLAVRRTRERGPAPETQSFHPGGTTDRAKSPRPEALTPHPIDDADYEELPRSSV